MRSFSAIYMREMKAYFHSPIAYVLLVGFLVLTGYFFYSAVSVYSILSLQAMQNPMMQGINLQDNVVAPLMGNMSIILMLITPLLTMRLLSEEKRTGTLELLLSYPISDTAVVLAKFAAAWTVLVAAMGLTTVHYLILGSMGDLHLPALAVSYLGLLCMAGCFTALGLLASAATENQIVAAVVGFAGLLMLWVLGWSAESAGAELGALLKDLSLGAHFENFLKGVIDTADLAYYLLFICLFLFMSIRVLEAKRWKA